MTQDELKTKTLSQSNFAEKAKASTEYVLEKSSSPTEKLMQVIQKMTPAIRMALPKGMSDERFTRIAMTCLRKNETLMRVALTNQASFLAALMQSVQLGLEPNTPIGQAYLIPYGKEVQFQVGYLGLIELAYRTGEYVSIDARAIYEQDEWDYQEGLDPILKHKPSPNRSGEPIAYYARYIRKDGAKAFYFAYRNDIETHAKKYSQAVQKGWTSPWKTDFDAMAKKTVIKGLLKTAQKSIEFSRQFEADETIKTDLDQDMLSVSPVFDVSDIGENDEK